MIKVITHTDLDGIGCAILIKKFKDEDLDISYCSYENVDDITMEVINEHNKYSKIFITDISVNEKVAMLLEDIKEKVVLIDHHKTALWLNKYSWATVITENEKGKTAATSLVYDYLTKDKSSNNIEVIELFIELVRRYDSWEWFNIFNDKSAKQLNDIFYIKGRENFFNDIMNTFNNNLSIFSAEDIIILEYRQKEIELYIEKKNKKLIETEILGHKAGAVFADNFISELGNQLSIMNPHFDFIVIINDNSISFRTSKDNVDVSEIAKHFGGGGHPKAAGCRITKKQMDKFMNILFKKNTIKDLFEKLI